jgi:CRISPR-associated endonuclease/helicase Cas3
LWHDFGKAHDVFKARCGLGPDAAPLAKTPNYNWRIKDVQQMEDGKKRDRNRRYFRHELASALTWLQHGPPGSAHDLIAYLIAAHHGKVRLRLSALPDERGPGDRPEARFARGVWDGDRLPALSVDGLSIPDTELRLDVMEIGGGATGRSWATRTLALLETYGPFRLAFLEALVRLADWRASEAEQADGAAQEGGEYA